jgi:NDP-sugar pyrophosphorylase family protein
MVKIDGIPVLERNLRWLAEWGFHEAAVNLHHLPDEVATHFVDGPVAGIEIFWSYEPELLGTAGTVTALRDWIDNDPFLVVYADNLFSVDLDAFVAAHRRAGRPATVALFERDDVSASGVAELGDDGRVTRFIEKPSAPETQSKLVNAGLLAFEPAALPLIPERGDLSTDVLPRLSSEGALGGYRLRAHERVLWIDTPTDLECTLSAFGVPA